jgi:hypothetical protein
VPCVTADAQLGRSVPTAAVALPRIQEIVGTQGHLDRLEFKHAGFEGRVVLPEPS